MSSRRSASIAANPVLIGAATVLVTVVAVFLAYNANSGLPFVPTYTLEAQLPNAAALVVGNEVRIAGTRVGTISRIVPRQDQRTGRVAAVLTLKLEKRIQPLPVDSTVIVRARSALGLKYLQITEGHSRRSFADRAMIPIANAKPEPVEIDQVFSTFDEPTRTGSQENLTTFGNAFAGRGQAINETIANLRPLVTTLTPVMRNLAAPATQLDRLFVSLGQAAAAAAPVAEQQADWFRGMDATFGALASVTKPYIQDAISEGPASLDQATASFKTERPFLRKSARFFHDLRPAAAALREASAPLGAAFEQGAPILRHAVGLNRRLDDVLTALAGFGNDPLALGGLHDLTDTARALNPLVQDLSAAQVNCNYLSLLLRNLGSALSDGDSAGTWLRFTVVLPALGPNSEGGPSSLPANGPNATNHVHSNVYPNVSAPGQTRECEAGNETYLPGRTVVGNVPGAQGLGHEATKAVVK
jgi:virulence factor Mce-like protein